MNMDERSTLVKEYHGLTGGILLGLFDATARTPELIASGQFKQDMKRSLVLRP